MVVTFRRDVPVIETMCFESVYEPELRMELDEKSEIIQAGIAAWIFVDGNIAGECYGARPVDVDDDLDTPAHLGRETIYCYSTTVLPPYQGRGLAKILCAYWSGLAAAAGFRTVAGHATSAAMVSVRRFFGARFLTSHDHWGGTDRVAVYYEMEL